MPLVVDATVVTKPGKQQISLDATPFYHCYSRCVRRAFLCGVDAHSGKSYEHRRQQIEDDPLRLTSVFFIDVAAFAVMSNHYHLVLFVDQAECKSASAKDVSNDGINYSRPRYFLALYQKRVS